MPPSRLGFRLAGGFLRVEEPKTAPSPSAIGAFAKRTRNTLRDAHALERPRLRRDPDPLPRCTGGRLEVDGVSRPRDGEGGDARGSFDDEDWGRGGGDWGVARSPRRGDAQSSDAKIYEAAKEVVSQLFSLK